MDRTSSFDAIRFHGTFREYQQNILDRLDRYLDDRKLHVVAAPGSGKTILGLEIIRRVGHPALIFAPTITVRDQWGERFREFFLEEEDAGESCISFDLFQPSLLTIATYQALYAAVRDEGRDPVPYLVSRGVRTICLDEAHHLRREWWNNLQEFMARFPDPDSTLHILSLTATPPYDSPPLEWTRYVNLCGEIDDEITVPELVAKDILCPHQDYLLLNPVRDDRESAARFRFAHIAAIASSEWDALGEDLRMVILTDYIRAEDLSYAGSDEVPVREGAVPLFEMLRRTFTGEDIEDPGIAVLTGSLVICREDCAEHLEKMQLSKALFSSRKLLPGTAYSVISVHGGQGDAVKVMTDAFSEGIIRILIGTKNLLGEGWDAPCVNSLVLASFVGSFVMSNQMRGRAIRTDRNHPEKVANIWHLAAADSSGSGVWGRPDGADGDSRRTEMEAMELRFRSFMGPSYEGNTIESGISRLGLPEVRTEDVLREWNGNTLVRSRARSSVARAWKEAIDESARYGSPRALEVVRISLDRVPERRLFGLSVRGGGSRRMQILGEAVLLTLREMRLIRSPDARVEVKREGGDLRCALAGAAVREENLFAECLTEMFSPLGRPRYLLLPDPGVMSKLFGMQHVFPCPALIGTKKEQASLLASALRGLGEYTAVYTANPAGSKALANARSLEMEDPAPDNAVRRIRMLL